MNHLHGIVRSNRSMLLFLGLFALIAVATQLSGVPLMQRIVTVMMINLILVLGLQVFMGNSGFLSFVHIGFMGIGAYTSALLAMPVRAKSAALPTLYPFLADIQLPFLPAVLLAALVAALVAAIFGYPLMRLSESAAAIASFAMLVIIHVVLSQWSAVTNGPRTLFGVLRYTDLMTAAMWALVIIAVAYLFKRSTLGLKLRASRDNIHAAYSLGINVVVVRWIAFVISAAICGLAGALWAHFITSFAPGAFYLAQTFVVLTMLIVGGPRTVSGAVVGVLAVTAVHEGLRHVENTLNTGGSLPFQVVGLTEVLLAAALIVMLAVRPGGLIQSGEAGSPKARTVPPQQSAHVAAEEAS
ncbi:branched-chain amino acid ABC transporter permease [Sphaerimonospora mesophila]|uniref:branched-chain amino acid ABC transporter permease n=1 Tax=Sphaerimonospora mesophila TaxID=37483 RepID=UPI0006E3D296